MKKSVIQLIKFGLVGVSNTLVSYVIYALMYTLTDNYVLANIVGWAISVLNAYVWQNLFVFKEEEGKEKRVWWKVLLKTYMAYGFTGLILSNVLLWLWLDVIGIGTYLGSVVAWLDNIGISITAEKFAGYIAPFLNMFITIPTNFLVNKFWAYRQK